MVESPPIGSHVAKRDPDGNPRVGKDGDLQGHERDHTCVTFGTCRGQLGDKGVQLQDISGVVGYQAVEVCGGLGHGEGDGVSGGKEDVGPGRRRRAEEVSGEGKEVLESERE
ncbi:hypothetical protein PanWU01x14_000980 [Parasponia andersonii]|uniref:Uncharacterized protein n=1 Tax=Parasponia andersonii TaxID=3476 RepID=A0A2P5E4T3_PARAD|nr:hypothetical protein PanWU01x14_000980 [Parasponia andersonii]